MWVDYLTFNLIYYDRSKNIVVDKRFVCELIVHGGLDVRYVLTKFQLADIFTKGLYSWQFLFLKHNTSIRPIQIKGAEI